MTRVAGPILFLHSRKPHAEYFSAIMGGWQEACLLAPLRLGRAVWLASGQAPSRGARLQLRALASLQVRKRTNGQPRWTRWVFAPRTLMLVWLAGRLYRSYRSRIEALQPRALVVWNGEKYYQAIAVRVAQDLGVTVLRFENGVLPGTTTLDRRGINADNSVPRDAAFYRSQADASDWIPPALTPRPPLPDKPLDSTTRELPARFLLAPFQIDGDTQILNHSPWVPDMRHFFQVTGEALEESGNPDLHLVYKEHPSTRRDFADLHARARAHPRLHFINDRPLPELLTRAEGVVTVNSTVGLEALLLRRPVITLGDAFYNISGLVCHVDSSRALAAAFTDPTALAPEEQLRRRFLRYLQFHYAVAGSWRRPDAAHVEAARARILALLADAP